MVIFNDLIQIIIQIHIDFVNNYFKICNEYYIYSKRLDEKYPKFISNGLADLQRLEERTSGDIKFLVRFPRLSRRRKGRSLILYFYFMRNSTLFLC